MIKSKITVINTGGTFNKRYNPLFGELDVPKDSLALDEIISYCYNIDFDVLNIISKDSLEMSDVDRELIVRTIKNCKNQTIVLTGAMLPISINKVEATLNFSQAIGFLNANIENGIYISMHGSVKNYKKLIKNRELGKFLEK